MFVITYSDARLATAMIVALGLALIWFGITLASQHIRFSISQDMQLVSTTDVALSAPARQVPCGCSAAEVVTKVVSVCFRMSGGRSALGYVATAPIFLKMSDTCRTLKTISSSIFFSR